MLIKLEVLGPTGHILLPKRQKKHEFKNLHDGKIFLSLRKIA